MKSDTTSKLSLATRFAKRLKTYLLGTSLIALSGTLLADDHPLLKRYPGANEYSSRFTEHETFTFPAGRITGESEPYAFPPLKKTGDLTLHTYTLNNVSSLKVFENYQHALVNAGFKTIYLCKTIDCGSEKQVAYLGGIISAASSVYNYYHNPYYLLSEKQSPNGTITVAVFIGAYEPEVNIQQVVLEQKTLQTDLIQFDMQYFKKPPQVKERTSISAAEREEDHPLISRYPGAKTATSKKMNYESIKLPVKVKLDNGNSFRVEKTLLVGDIYQHIYQLKNVSTLKVYQNYRRALEKANFQISFECKLDECGDKAQVEQLGASISVDKSIYNSSHKPYFISATHTAKKGDIYFSSFIGGYGEEVSIYQTIVELEASEDDLIQVDAEGLKQDIEQTGKALLYGIYFDTDKATIKPESKPTLDAVAELLNKDKDLLLYVVGHTDDTGALTHNQQLSLLRAQAVVSVLVSKYQIDSQRLVSAGVGPYVPESNNTSNAGRRLNRRVELVKRLN